MSKKEMFMGGYYLVMIFFVSCALYDLINETVTGFTFGYVFALFYFIYRARVVSEHLSYLEKKDEDLS